MFVRIKMYNIDILSIKEQISLLHKLEKSLFKKLSDKLQVNFSFKIELIKNKNCNYIVIHVLKYKLIIKNVEDNLKLGIINSDNYSESILIKELSININEDIKLIYNCELCDKDEDIDIYFKNECDNCKYIFYKLSCQKYEKGVKNILNINIKENGEEDIKIIIIFIKELENFFSNNITKIIK